MKESLIYRGGRGERVNPGEGRVWQREGGNDGSMGRRGGGGRFKGIVKCGEATHHQPYETMRKDRSEVCEATNSQLREARR